MRILVISNIYPPIVRGGYEVECSGVVESLRARGDDVLVLTSDTPMRTDVHQPDVVRALPIRAAKRSDRVVAPLQAMRGVGVVRKHLLSFRPNLAFVWNGANLPNSAIAEIIASETATAFRVCEWWFSRLFREDVFMRYLPPHQPALRRPWAAVLRSLNRLPALGVPADLHADVAISWVSNYLRQAVVVPDGLNPVIERTIHATTQNAPLFAEVPRRPAATPLLAFIGRLSREKGADVAIRALGVLADRGIEAELVLAGVGSHSDLRRLERAAVQANVRQRCEFAGHLEPSALADLLSRASVLVMPSVWQEPLGLVAQEAALARVPLVASRIGGIPELVSDNEAKLVSPGDAEALADGVLDVLVRPLDAKIRAEAAFTRARKLSWEAYVDAMLGFVDDAYEALTRESRYRRTGER